MTPNDLVELTSVLSFRRKIRPATRRQAHAGSGSYPGKTPCVYVALSPVPCLEGMSPSRRRPGTNEYTAEWRGPEDCRDDYGYIGEPSASG